MHIVYCTHIYITSLATSAAAPAGLAVCHGCGYLNELTNMIGNKNDYSWLWAFLILFSAVLNIAVQASVLVPVSKVQLLREADSEIKLHKRNGWEPGKLEERAFGLHLLGSRLNTRMKRYDRNAWKNWKPGDSDPWADTQADYKRQYNAEQASNRRQKGANRRHREEVGR